LVQLAVTIATRAEFSDERAAAAELLDAIVESIGNKDVSRSINRYSGWSDKLAIATAARAEFGDE
jgi:hypothetical protein